MAIRRRKGTNFFKKDQVSSTSFVLVADWDFNSIGIALMVESNDPTDVIEYSFGDRDQNGELAVAGDMTPLMPSEGIIFDNRAENCVYMRRKTAGAPVTVRIEAWRFEA